MILTPDIFISFTNQHVLKNYDDPLVQSLIEQVIQSPQFSINKQFDKGIHTLLHFLAVWIDFDNSAKFVQHLLKLNADPT